VLLPRACRNEPSGSTCKTFDLLALRNEILRNLGIELAVLNELIEVSKAQLFAELPRNSMSRSSRRCRQFAHIEIQLAIVPTLVLPSSLSVGMALMNEKVVWQNII